MIETQSHAKHLIYGMRLLLLNIALIGTLAVGGCSFNKSSSPEAERQRKQDADTAAQKAGRAAHKIATESEEAAKKAGREIKKAAQEMKEGWKEAEREERAKPKK